MKYLVFDVESIGLHGEPFAVGWVVVNELGNEESRGCFSVFPGIVSGDPEDRKWCEENLPDLPVTHATLQEMLSDFWSVWKAHKSEGGMMLAECLWPVESKFLSMCVGVDFPESKWDGPYPFHEISSFLMAAGMDPMASYDRLESEIPKHHPEADARQSARLFLEAIAKIKRG